MLKDSLYCVANCQYIKCTKNREHINYKTFNKQPASFADLSTECSNFKPTNKRKYRKI